jgi:hypothetical protein
MPLSELCSCLRLDNYLQQLVDKGRRRHFYAESHSVTFESDQVGSAGICSGCVLARVNKNPCNKEVTIIKRNVVVTPVEYET